MRVGLPAIEDAAGGQKGLQAQKMFMVDDFGIGGVCKRVPGVKLLDIMLGPVHKFVFDGFVDQHIIRGDAGLPGV